MKITLKNCSQKEPLNIDRRCSLQKLWPICERGAPATAPPPAPRPVIPHRGATSGIEADILRSSQNRLTKMKGILRFRPKAILATLQICIFGRTAPTECRFFPFHERERHHCVNSGLRLRQF